MKISRLAGLFVAVVLASPPVAHAQGLSDLAKKEKDRQARARAEGGKTKVYTEIPRDPTAPRPDETTENADTPAPGAAVLPEPSPASVVTPVPDRATARKARPTERSSARAYRTVNVTMYATSWCGYCRKARAFLATQPNVNVVVHDIEENKARESEMLAKTGGRTGVPVIDVEGIVLKGYSATAITNALAAIRNR